MVPPPPMLKWKMHCIPNRVLVAVRKPYQAKVFANAGSMSKSEGKVDEGTGPAELIYYNNIITYLTFQVATTLPLVYSHLSE